MAIELITANEGSDKHLYVEWSADVLYEALAPLKAAIIRAEHYHQDDTDVLDSLLVLDRLVESAADRLKEFDNTVREHHGEVGVCRAQYGHPRMSPKAIAGVRFRPKKDALEVPAMEGVA